MDDLKRERKGRTFIQSLGLNGIPHESIATHKHLAHPAAMKPTSLDDIAQKVKSNMENIKKDLRE